MEETLYSDRKTARLAGILYAIIVSIAAFGMGYIPARIYVPQDIGATTNNLLSNEFLFRTGIISHLVSTTTIAFMVLVLYRLFRPVDKNLSRLMVVPVIIQVPIVLILECFNIAALMILKSEGLLTIDVGVKQELSFLMLRLHGYGIGSSQLFWGLWLFPFGALVNRSRFIPQIFGILLLINGVGYVVEAFAYILLQRPDYLVVRQFARVTFIGLPLTMLWFLIKGVRDRRTPT